ncbi:MAG TPA: DNA-binding domain-containing protein [Vicinamibacteria bacterium]|nr:DNA-binding domain-containing protein [Vicinamibacteria bacterium]
MVPELALGGLQRWMQSVIVHPGSITEALKSGAAASLLSPERTGDVIRPSATLGPAERIGIYHGMYRPRMAEALESDYPALADFLGAEGWLELVGRYCEAHPSRSYTLNVLGRHLPEWLARDTGVPKRGFCRELARLEWAVVEAFDAAEAPRLGEAALLAVPAEAWPAARLVPSPSLRLVELRWNANEWLDSTKDDRHEHPRPARREAWVAVFRVDYAVYRRELRRPAFRLLSDLAAGVAAGPALAAAMRRRGGPDSETLTRWFHDWAADGLFTRVDLGGGAAS